ncbi:hypothetical protein ZEAMMB73_Zm00001d048022 [Zea mays]|uniref:Uncharacterized protein n=1 Tax=Zea mays TaxID=4577 RepID=A0A1D6PFS3_MAIZE|nr:hypothetical protein ZEAMMB73_Zm00001d048022 [Zea mays]
MGQEVATSYVNNLRSMIEVHIRALVDKEVDNILRKCGLSNKMPYIKEYGSKVDARRFLCLNLSNCRVPRLRSNACYGLARALAESYNNYPDPRSLVKHSPEQIRTILEI